MKTNLKGVRLCFAQALFEAKRFGNDPNAALRHSSSFIISPKDPQIPAFKQVISAVATEAWGEKAAELLKALSAQDKLCLHDGDTKPEYEGFPGNLFISASSKLPPTVVDAPGTAVLYANRDPDKKYFMPLNKDGTVNTNGALLPILTALDGRPYSGCYVNVTLDIWAQDSNQYGKRINAQLIAVQFVKDGERLGGGSVATADDFEAIPTAGGEPTQGATDASSLF